MKSVRTPPLLTDLYRDLRDRRLLVPALGLAAALIVVPMALSSSATPSPTAPATGPGSSGPGKETAAEPAVLTRQLGFTAYRRRLERVNSTNPFEQQFTVPEVTSEVQQSSVTEPSGVTTSEGGSTSTPSTAEPTSAPSTSPETNTPTARSSEPSDDAQKPTTEVILRRIDVKVGPEGDLVKKTGIKQLKMLPSSTTPVVIFLGTSERGQRAFFLVSSDVTAVSGDGVCLATTPTCQLLTLKADEVASFDYAPDMLTYKLKLLAIRDVVVKKTRLASHPGS
jgi:hypothetical protein